MNNITFVTGNYGKYASVKNKFEKRGIEIDYVSIDIDEPDINDIELISKEKAKVAFEKVGSPVFVIDCGFYIRSYPNNPYYPGAFVKRSGIAKKTDELLSIMSDVEDRYCYFLDCLTYFDGDEYTQFFGKSEGYLSYVPKGTQRMEAMSNLWHIFIPKNCDKSLAEMSIEERINRKDDRVDATQEFINWLKEKEISKSVKKLVINNKLN